MQELHQAVRAYYIACANWLAFPNYARHGKPCRFDGLMVQLVSEEEQSLLKEWTEDAYRHEIWGQLRDALRAILLVACAVAVIGKDGFWWWTPHVSLLVAAGVLLGRKAAMEPENLRLLREFRSWMKRWKLGEVWFYEPEKEWREWLELQSSKSGKQ